jgi:hypothetical protein
MTWFAFKGYNSNQPIDLAGFQEKEAVSLGFHGYATAKDAIAHPNSVNFANSFFVNSIIADYHSAVSTGTQPGGPNSIWDIPGNVADNWLKSLGGSIGSGLEAGAVSLLKDIWDVIIGPVQIIAGILLGILIVFWAFRGTQEQIQ